MGLSVSSPGRRCGGLIPLPYRASMRATREAPRRLAVKSPLLANECAIQVRSTMWLCTKLGFYSIVKKGKPGEWQVRARLKQDLENLLVIAKVKSEIISTPNADYACRAILDWRQIQEVFTALAKSIDYPNFKDKVHETP